MNKCQYFLLSIFCYFIIATASRAAENVFCDPTLAQVKDTPNGYRERGDRCEGIYFKEVSAATLTIASFTESFEDYDPSNLKPILVDWDTLPNGAELRLRAQGLKRRLYYRMDTVISSDNHSYSWRPELLSALNIRKNDLGIVGIVRQANNQRNVYVPLRLHQKGNVTLSGNYSLVLLPGVELQEVYITLEKIGQNGQPEKPLKDGEKLGYGYYPAERGIDIPLSGLATAGLYHLEIGSTLRFGGTSTIELWFQHQGNNT